MRALLGVVLVVGILAGIDPCKGSILPRAYVPPHIPMTVVDPTPVFEVPWWLGGYVASVNESSNWTLPLTYPNGGRTNIGVTLVIQNRGPENITLYAQGNETVQGLDSYLVVAYSTVQLLSDTDWVVVSTTFGTEGMDGNYAYLQAQNASVQCWLGVGTSNPINQQCGDLKATRIVVGEDVALDPHTTFRSYKTYTDTDINAQQAFISRFIVSNSQPSAATNEAFITTTTATGSSAASRAVSIVNSRFSVNYNAAGTLSGSTGIKNLVLTTRFTGSTNFTSPASISKVVLLSHEPFAGGGGTATGNIVSMSVEEFQPPSASMNSLTCANYINSNYNTNSVTVSAIKAHIMLGLMSGGATNYGIWFNTNSASAGAGMCAGTAGDVCLYRAAAGVWTFNSGTSLRVPGYGCVGCDGAAPSNTAAGAFTTTKASPALQAFGAVTANAASGVLAFTVSTAAQTCGTAVITNTNVVAGSEVILTIQKYTGTYFTNGYPGVSREDTSGSSAGSFTLQLCNSHATNALSGNLYVAFWVLN